LTWRSIGKILISAALIAWLFYRIGINHIFSQIIAVKWPWMIYSLAVFVASNILGGWQWFLLLKAKGLKISFWNAQSFYHIGLFFNNFLIGYIGGDAFRIYDVKRKSGDIVHAFSTVFFDRFIGFFMITTIAMITTVIALPALIDSDVGYTIAVILIIWLMALLILFNEKIARRFSWFSRFLPFRLQNKLGEIYLSLNQFRHNKKFLVRIFGIAMVVQILRILTHLLMALAIGVRIPSVYFFVFIPIIGIISSLPISVGGIGVREQSSVTLFGQLGISPGPVVAFEFLAYFISIIATLPGGVLFIFRKKN
jgi:uncharacterized protein (TIRG00374 family)